MKRLAYGVVLLLMLLTAGFVVGRSIQGNSYSMPTPLPTALADFPDIDHVPVYANASVTKAENESPAFRHIVYEAQDSMDRVNAFYRDTLTQKGWVIGSTRQQASLYSWSDPSGKSPWHLYLVVVIGLTLDDSKVLVNLDYGRYPDTGGGLPLYPDAQRVETTHSNVERSAESKKTQVQINEITYLSNANPNEIAGFYNHSLVDYGWSFYDRAGPGPSSTQTGDISSPEGLYFRSRHKGWQMAGSEAEDLFITATTQNNGQTLVKLHAEQFEIPSSGF